MIRYLQQHNTNLGKRIVELTQLLPKDKQQTILNTSNIAPHLHPQRQTFESQENYIGAKFSGSTKSTNHKSWKRITLEKYQ